ncbi:MAG: hypothetical protein HY694_05780 [Deltaproteobacteria bacterium]|nr:hypothetical protein [Deltaproteobacteria bacterium]
MKVEYIAQPDIQLGKVLSGLLKHDPPARRIVFVSAFVGLQTVIRIKHQIAALRAANTAVRFVLGIDLGGTSQEVLRELLGWNIETLIVKHRIPGHTFHPKIYFFEWDDRAEIIVGSSNVTEGGFFGNYESCVRITYDFPVDLEACTSAQTELSRFLNPGGPITYPLTETLLNQLIARNAIPTEAEARKNRDIGLTAKLKSETGKQGAEKAIFGTEHIDLPPPLPADLLERLIQNVRHRREDARRARKKKTKPSPAQSPIGTKGEDPLSPGAFYMTLPTLQGEKIPGEARIPLEAIELAREFWGWPEEYEKDVSPRAGKNRVYWNWRPAWRVWSVKNPDDVNTQRVRMYMYTNSSDFRFYVRPLVNAGADLGDVVCIRRIAEPDAEYECALAQKSTPEYDEWINYCTQPVRNSTRHFGYA